MKNPSLLLTVGVCLAAVVPSQAQVLIPGGGALPVDVAPALSGAFSPFTDTPFSAGSVSGILTSFSITGDPGNPFTGGLTFVYSISNAGPDDIVGLTLSGFSGLHVKVAEFSSGGGVAPASATRGSGLGDEVSFFFATPGTAIPSGSPSHLLMVQTSATASSLGAATVFGTGGSATPVALTAVPEPSSYAVMGGLGLLGFAAWRRRKA